MVLPTRARYWLVSLQRFNRPWLWSGLVLLVLGGVVGRQYFLHPEWYGRFNVPADSPGEASLANTTLTPDEQAQIADIDTLNTLMQEMGLGPISPDGTEAPIPSEAENQDLLSLLQQPAASRLTPNTPKASNGNSPFSDYLEQYKFAGGQPSPTSQGQSTSQSSLLQLGLVAPNGVPGNTASPPSALQQALTSQLGGNSQPGGSTTDDSRLSPPQPTAAAGTGDHQPVGLEPPAWLIQGFLPGSNQPFIRTTPEMSPPPGTTGYTLPPGMSPQPSAGSSGAYPNFTPARPAVPSPGTASGLDLSPGNLGGSAGAVSQPPIGGSAYTAPSGTVPPPEVFVVPRFPGGYTGGGYINTFSDPGGYAN